MAAFVNDLVNARERFFMNLMIATVPALLNDSFLNVFVKTCVDAFLNVCVRANVFMISLINAFVNALCPVLISNCETQAQY